MYKNNLSTYLYDNNFLLENSVICFLLRIKLFCVNFIDMIGEVMLLV